jgi:hypothetical protein
MNELEDQTSHWPDWAAPRLAARKRELGVIADFGVVGDLFAVVTQLIEEIGKRK